MSRSALLIVDRDPDKSAVVKYLKTAISQGNGLAQILVTIMADPYHREETLRKVREVLEKTICPEKAAKLVYPLFQICKRYGCECHYIIRSFCLVNDGGRKILLGGKISAAKDFASKPLENRAKRALLNSKFGKKIKGKCKIRPISVELKEESGFIDFIFEME